MMEQGVRLQEVNPHDVGRRIRADREVTQVDVIELHPRTRATYRHEEDSPFDPSTFSVAQPGKSTELLIRLLDLFGSLFILLCALPLMLAAAVAIKLTSRGPVLYSQERVGKGGRLFNLYKFRTMIDGAERHVGPVLASKDDHRVTAVGRILRRTRMDELPQLYNILRGDMSLVGPRPERPFFVQRHKALQGIRLVVKPGLTGLAQVRSFYDLKPAHKVKYDYIYIQNRSLLLNLYILLQTIPVLFAKKGW
ncbi:MAG TPA: sugar transferase [Sedimentisphaerales bacterium]|nr:sugar transferase [Sedimentisphaerales bacterium]HRS10925.1 sugar transferase [Sedimentisphaerales bacterium]HRV47629.1 sugar transferase [Sedimentisphaerales bacterium]